MVTPRVIEVPFYSIDVIYHVTPLTSPTHVTQHTQHVVHVVRVTLFLEISKTFERSIYRDCNLLNSLGGCI